MKTVLNKHWLLPAGILVAVCFFLHSGNYDHEFLLDSTYGLVDNPAVRSLKNIPSYFSDPSTLTNLRANWDYRPVLQVTYALNYWLSGYDMWSWHLTQIILHCACVVGLYFLGQRLLAVFKPDEDKALQRRIAFAAALIFAVHPYVSGVVNYLWARSSLLVSALLVFSFLLYMRKQEEGKRRGPAWGALALYTLALFAKVEAVAALGVFWLFEAVCPGGRVRTRAKESNEPWERLRNGFLGDVVRSLDVSTLMRLLPFLVVTAAYAVIRVRVVPDFVADARHSGDVTPFIYFITQLTAWWHYVLTWFAPVNLVGDNLAYPVFRSLLAPEALLAVSGWLLAALVLAACYRAYPEYLFFTVAALAIISPTSSIAPLAEMVNEHRPYLPLALLSLAWIAVAGRWFSLMVARKMLSRAQIIAVFLAVVASLGLLTIDRNKVYATGEAYWADVVQKAPSARAHVNYGLELMAGGDVEGAMEHYQKSLEMAPRWHITHINLGLGYERLGNGDKALFHYNCAVRDEVYGAQALGYRGGYFLRAGRYAEALADYEQSLELATDLYATYKGIATGAAGTGDWQKAADMTKRMCEIQPDSCENEIVAMASPFWSNLVLYEPGIRYFQAISEFLPGRWWIYQNVGDLAFKLGKEDLYNEAFEKSTLLQQKAGTL